MIKLHQSLTLAARPDEPPASYVSVLARRLGRTPHSLALEMGTTYQKVIEGEPDAIARIIEVCGLPEYAFSTTAIVKVGTGNSINGEAFPQHALRRSRHFVCPICVREDVEQGEDVRSQLLPAITVAHACSKHDALYVSAFSSKDSRRAYDFAWHMQQSIDNGLLACDPDFVTSSHDSIQYLAARLKREQPGSWLDEIPAFAVARFAEVFGLEMVFQKVREWKSVTPAEWHDAASLGFQAILAGKEEIKRELVRIRAGRSEDFLAHTWKESYGNLHDYLVRGNGTYAALAPFREIVHEHIVETVPVDKGLLVFGIPVAERKIHSLKSGCAIVGISPKTLHRRLQSLGFVGPDKSGLAQSAVLFDAEAVTEQLLRMKESMSKTAALKYLNVKDSVGKTIFSAELIPHVYTPGKARRIKGYLKVDLDAFLKSLRDKVTDCNGSAGLVPIPHSVSPARTPLNELVGLVLDGRLTKVAFDESRHGIQSILVDPAEVKAVRHALSPDRVSVPTAAELLDMHYPLTSKLVSAGIIPCRVGRNSVTGQDHRTVAIEDLDAFASTYISLGAIAAKMKVDSRFARALLRVEAIKPVFERPTIPSTFFRRSEVDRILREH